MIGYFDNAATSYPKPDGMYNAISEHMAHYGANVGRGSYQSSIISGKLVTDTRNNILQIMNAPQNKCVVFTPSATIALNTIIFGVELSDGDTVYVSHFEHNAVLRPLYAIQKKVKIQIEFLPMCFDDKFVYDLNKIKTSFSSIKPKLVIVSQVSNVLGLISPVNDIMSVAQKYGAITVVDGSQSCGLIDCPLNSIDYYVFAGHKSLLGPTGIGGFICNKDSSLKPFVYGGTGIDSANKGMPEYVPERFEAGTMNLMSIVGLHYSTEWILHNLSLVRSKESDNLNSLRRLLNKYSYLEIISPKENISSIIACRVSGYTSDEIGNILSERGIAVRTGLHCAPLAHKYIGSAPEGLVRFSISCLTTDDDFDLLNKVLNQLSVDLT